MSAIFPTASPWQIKHDFDIEGSTTIIGNVDGEIIEGTTHYTYDFVARTLDEDDDSQSRSIAAANARFIVRACNSFNALVQALVALDADARPSNWDDEDDPAQVAAWQKLDAAITKARGQ